MDLLASTGTSLLLVNLVFAAIALAVGFAAGAWICGNGSGTERASEPSEPEIEDDGHRLVLENTMLASDRLRDLATSVASDVGAHNQNIERIEAELAGSGLRGEEISAEAVVRAMEQITQANEQLQGRLAKAEEQIKTQAEQIRTHESEARTDSLTSLANRRAFDDELKRRLAEWERHETPFSLMILDVDHFKKFNDTHGHQAGDEVLRKVGKALTDCVRDLDLPCRYGGEEFAIVMPKTEGVEGCPLAERVRTKVEALAIPFEGKTLNVTTSVGLTSAIPGDTASTIIRRADDALYVSKDAGRNNGHRHTGSETTPITPGKSPRPAAKKGGDAADATPTTALDALPNRTRFLELVRTEVRVAQDASTPVTLLTAELAGYAELEAEFGSAVARLTIDSIAQFLANAIRDVDSLGRLDDGQFVVLMPNQGAAEAEQIGERISAALANCTVPLGDGHLKLTTSMTVHELKPEDTAASLMGRAEEGLRKGGSTAAAPLAV